MRDVDIAVEALSGHTLALCRAGSILTCDLRGISPMMQLIAEGRELAGYSAADLVVGKAAALLFAYAHVVCVHAKVISEGAISVLQKYGIEFSFEVRTPHIVNRRGDGICPMEQAVADTENADVAYGLLQARLQELSKNKEK